MKTCDEMVNSLLKRRERFLLDQKRKRKTAAHLTAAGACCALSVAVGVLVLNSGMLREKKTVIPDDRSAVSDNSSSVNDEPQTPTVVDDSSVIWGVLSAVTSHEDELMAPQKKWNGKNIDYSLYYAFEEYDDNCTFAVFATHICYDDNCSFTKTLEQFLAEDYARTERIWRLENLTKLGDDLKYGEALYLTGTPDGVKWTKEYYDRTVSEIGKELLSKYNIMNGEFLKDELIRDLDTEYAEREKAMDAYYKSFDEHKTDACKTLKKELEEKGISCELNSNSTALIIYISETDFAELTLEDPGNCIFGLAAKISDEDICDLNSDPIVITENE